MKHKKKKKASRFILTFLFVIYITIYIAQKSGYMDFQNYKKAYLTKEKIAQFEQDVKSGKKVDLTKYQEVDKKNYSNQLSNIGYDVSNCVSSLVNKGVISFFDTIANLAKE